MKLTITRVLETSKILAGEIGQAIPEFFNFMAEFVDQVIRALRNGLNFRDNFDCQIKIVSLRHDTSQIVSADRQVEGVIPIRVVRQGIMLRDFGWWYDDNNRLTMRASYDTNPQSAVDVLVVILF